MAPESPGRIVAPRLADALCALAENQLQIHASKSAALDAGAFGVMSADTAIVAIMVGVQPPGHLWLVALIPLGLSFGLALQALLLKGAERIGPSPAHILKARRTHADDSLEEWLLEDLAADVLANQRALARKTPLLTGALTLMAFCVLLELAGLIR